MGKNKIKEWKEIDRRRRSNEKITESIRFPLRKSGENFDLRLHGEKFHFTIPPCDGNVSINHFFIIYV